MTNSYSGEDLQTGSPSPASTLNLGTERGSESNLTVPGGRHNLKKYPSSKDADEIKGFKRFSKRQSKSGMPAVF